MKTKSIRSILIFLQIVIIGFLLLSDICAIATVGSFSKSYLLIASFIRCVAILAFTVFYYVSVSDSFSSDSLVFPLYLLFVSVSESRILEDVQNIMNFHIIPPSILVATLVFSSFMIVLCLIGYALLSNSSKSDLSLYTIASITASLAVTYYAPISTGISSSWNSKTLYLILTFLFGLGVIISVIQAILESSKSARVKYWVCILLLTNEYINLIFDSLIMNAVGTLLFIVSLLFVIVLVKVNSTRL